MPEKSESNEQTFGIGAVARLTGMSDHTIRVWERRYEAVVAQRTSNGRRIYTAADVEKLSLLKLLTDRGLSIGQIAGESLGELKERVESMTELAATPAPSEIKVAVLGEFLPARIKRYQGDLSPLNCMIADTNPDRFLADLGQQSVDVLIYESAVLDSENSKQLRKFMRASKARKAIFVYGFGRSEDADRLRKAGVVLLRGSVGIDELVAAVAASYEAPRTSGVPKSSADSAIVDQDWAIDGEIQPRIFTQEQLSTLANTASSIDCECPQNLAQLVVDLSAFEMYSANCESRGEEDAALHRFLHETTSQARALIEKGLERVAVAEGLSY